MATITEGTYPIQWNVVVNTNGAENTKKKRMNCSMCRYVNGIGVDTIRSMDLYADRQISNCW